MGLVHPAPKSMPADAQLQFEMPTSKLRPQSGNDIFANVHHQGDPPRGDSARARFPGLIPDSRVRGRLEHRAAPKRLGMSLHRNYVQDTAVRVPRQRNTVYS